MAVYLDSSAAVKLIVREAESEALESWLRPHDVLTSSALLRTELLRAIRRGAPRKIAEARAALAAFTLRAVDDEILDVAGDIGPSSIRSLDAIHLATALRLATALDAIVTYDRRMIEGAVLLGLPVASPS
ncbi:MAG: type II toxin-antitoxin system VapC family toxin [Chloroflexota bacterium]|nr:type II toxin-antitoxin system VapC family toxin [Chloroflexota bacterium]